MLLEALRKPDPVMSWVYQFSPHLTAALLSYFKVVRHKDSVSLDPNRFLLSEMGLCGVIHRLALPEGYHMVHGKVSIGGNDTISTKHIFAMSGDRIVCITPGQFVEPLDKNLKKGERVEKLIKKDPRHIIVDGELAVLFGRKKDIERVYDLEYSTQ